MKAETRKLMGNMEPELAREAAVEAVRDINGMSLMYDRAKLVEAAFVSGASYGEAMASAKGVLDNIDGMSWKDFKKEAEK